MSALESAGCQFALSQYGEYLRTCIRYPELTSWLAASRYLNILDVKEAWNQNTAETEKYFWFVGYALHVFDIVLAECPEYSGAIQKNLEFHIPTLTKLWKQAWRDIHSDALNILVGEVTGVGEDA
jgi:hypothetical protein